MQEELMARGHMPQFQSQNTVDTTDSYEQFERTHRWESYRWRYRHPRQPGATSVNAYNISRWDSLHTYLNLGDLAKPIRQGDAFAKEKLQQINQDQGKKAERSPWESYSG